MKELLLIFAYLIVTNGIFAQTPEKDPAYADLTRAFDALRMRDYDRAISSFQNASLASPTRADIYKNLAYTLLKVGETEEARAAFGTAAKLDPNDFHVALEYAFLCYESKDDGPARKAEARRIFLGISQTGDTESRATAARIFANIDGPLADGIARWRRVLETSAPNFSAHFELAQLAETRDELAVAAANYRAAFQLLPERKSVLIDLARVEKARGNGDGAMAALLAASRGGEARGAELARELLPERYPYVYEFRNALELDPKNNELHRELAYLLLSMSEKGAAKPEEAEKEFHEIVKHNPDDYVAASQLGLIYLRRQDTAAAMQLLSGVLKNADAKTANRVRMTLQIPLVLEDRSAEESGIDARLQAERSYNAGFLKDALRYYRQAREANPVDADIALKLGWTNNMLHDDASALRWFGIARKSSDSRVATQAEKAYRSLLPGVERIRTTVWVFPMFSSRWKDLFGYGQMKSEIKLGNLPIRPYFSVRFVGDTRVRTDTYPIQSLSESSFIIAGGAATRYWHGAMGWFEAGSSVGYQTGTPVRDVRGGLSWSRFRGASLLSETDGRFFEATADAVYVSRFNNDLINNSQNKIGWTNTTGPLRTQWFWNANLTFDAKRQYWANFAETGPGFRFRPPSAPPPVAITVSMLRGIYLVNYNNPRRPNFWDLRIGVWYAFTH